MLIASNHHSISSCSPTPPRQTDVLVVGSPHQPPATGSKLTFLERIAEQIFDIAADKFEIVLVGFALSELGHACVVCIELDHILALARKS